jgi:hypothetical protein
MHLIVFPGTPFRIIEVVADPRIFSIQDMNLSPNLKYLSIYMMALYCTLSNDFSKSTLKITIYFFYLWKISKYSYAQAR